MIISRNPMAFAFLLSAVLVTLASSHLVLLDVKSANSEKHGICADYVLNRRSSLKDYDETFQVGWWDRRSNEFDVCIPNSENLIGKVVPLNGLESTARYSDLCPVTTHYLEPQLKQLEKANAAAAFISRVEFDKSRYLNPATNISVFAVDNERFNEITLLIVDLISFRFYHPSEPIFDPSKVVIILLATVSISLGAFWHAWDQKRQLVKKVVVISQVVEMEKGGIAKVNLGTEDPQVTTFFFFKTKESTRQRLTDCAWRTLKVVLYVIIAVLALVALEQILTQVFAFSHVSCRNISYAIVSTIAMQACVMFVIRRFVRDPKWTSFAKLTGIEHREFLSFWTPFIYQPLRPIGFVVFALLCGFTAVVYMHLQNPIAYFLTNIFTVCICACLIKLGAKYLLHQLPAIMTFLIIMAILDVLVVVLASYFKMSGLSLFDQMMASSFDLEEVSSAVDNAEIQIPQLFHAPLLLSPFAHCLKPYVIRSILGACDVIYPGFLLAFAFKMDVYKKTRSYGLITLVGYVVGLIITYVVVTLTGMAQPALLYLVPATLIPFIVLCLCKGTLKETLTGDIKIIQE